jgi:DNA (cytosine-5)-methyltransferase 1
MGWQPAAFSEIEPFPSAVLAHHYPTVPNVGDMTKYKEWDIGAIDLLVGGTPCQSFSVAGLRKGLADPRGNLALVYLGIADLFKPKWIVWENVPGVLSSGGGRDFGSFLGALAQLGYGFAYRVLDAQWFGVAQRRRRVFVVGYLGDWRPAAAVLFERQSLSGHPKPSREKGEDPAKSLMASPSQRLDPTLETMIPIGVPEVMSTLLSSTAGISRPGNAATEHETYIPMAPIPYDLHQVTAPVNRQAREPGDPCHTLAKQNAHNAGIVQPIAFHATQEPINGPVSPALGSNMYAGVAVDVYNQAIDGQTAATLTEACGGSNTSGPKVMQSMAVRRLTPVECERLQGFPDNYTEIPWRGKAETPDGPRYKALGNSMAVPVMRWIGQRIQGR